MTNLFRSLLSDEHGATAIEYALICALVGTVSIGALSALGEKTESVYTEVNAAMEGSASSTPMSNGGSNSGSSSRPHGAIALHSGLF
jgi:pilus assembly protein Flp/PilA